MTMLTIRNLDPEVKDRLRERAARNGRSMEAEARALLAEAVAPRAEEGILDVFYDVFRNVEVDLDLPRAQDEPRYMTLDR